MQSLNQESKYIPNREIKHYSDSDFVFISEFYKNADFTYKFLGVGKKNYIAKAAQLDCYYPKYIYVKRKAVLNPEYNENVPELSIVWNDSAETTFSIDLKITDRVIQALKDEEKDHRFFAEDPISDSKELQSNNNFGPFEGLFSQIVDECSNRVTDKLAESLSQKVIFAVSSSITAQINLKLENQLKVFQESILNNLPSLDPLDSLIETLINFKTNSVDNFKSLISPEDEKKLNMLERFNKLVNTEEFKNYQSFISGQSEEFSQFCQWKLEGSKPKEPQVVEKIVEKEVKVVDGEILKKKVQEELEAIAVRKGYPTRKEFICLMQNYENYNQIAKAKKVSPATVRNWAKFYGIESKPALKLQNRL